MINTCSIIVAVTDVYSCLAKAHYSKINFLLNFLITSFLNKVQKHSNENVHRVWKQVVLYSDQTLTVWVKKLLTALTQVIGFYNNPYSITTVMISKGQKNYVKISFNVFISFATFSCICCLCWLRPFYPAKGSMWIQFQIGSVSTGIHSFIPNSRTGPWTKCFLGSQSQYSYRTVSWVLLCHMHNQQNCYLWFGSCS